MFARRSRPAVSSPRTSSPAWRRRLRQSGRKPTQKRPLTEALIAAGALTVEGLEPGMAAFAMVDVAASSREADGGSLALSTAFAKQDATAIVAETPSSNSGAARRGSRARSAGIRHAGHRDRHVHSDRAHDRGGARVLRARRRRNRPVSADSREVASRVRSARRISAIETCTN